MSSNPAKDMAMWLLFAAFLTGAGLSNGVSLLADEPTIVVEKIGTEAYPVGRVKVESLPSGVMAVLKKLDAAELKTCLAVYVVGKQDTNPIALFGEHVVSEDSLEFVPRFPFRQGVRYEAVFNVNGEGLKRHGLIKPLKQTFDIPKPNDGPPTKVTAVYPSVDVLPENLFKFYIHFSQPMSRGFSYDSVELLDEKGDAIELPFLELGQELWNPAGTRFTLLFDPGRIKKDLKPNRDVGPPLRAGQSYTLAISKKWRDAQGDVLESPIRKTFRVIEMDTVQPKVENWNIESPKAKTRQPLVVRFNESLDHGLLQDSISVLFSSGSIVEGTVDVSQGEKAWLFVPKRRWEAGQYHLSVEQRLEDVAANSVGRAFETKGELEGKEEKNLSPIRRLFTVE